MFFFHVELNRMFKAKIQPIVQQNTAFCVLNTLDIPYFDVEKVTLLAPWVGHGRPQPPQALMGACAQPRLSRPLAKIAVAALADAAERGANASEALQQAERGVQGGGII